MSNIPLANKSIEPGGLSCNSPSVPSVFWLALPVLCIGLALVALLILSDVQLNISGDWLAQHALFVQINSTLSYLPVFFWAALSELGDAIVLIPILDFRVVVKGPASAG